MVLCLLSVVNAHVEIIIPGGGQRERFCQLEPSGCKRHTSEVKVNYQTNSRAPRPRPSFKDYIVLLDGVALL